MPIYEFYCSDCNRIFNFYSKTVNTEKRPLCPKCGKVKLERWMSVFTTVRNKGDSEADEDMAIPDMDESKMEKAMDLLAREAEHIDEEDPRQAANLMRKLTDMTGLKLGPGMEEALRRMEAGEDPEQIEEEMGDLLEEEDPFQFQDKKGSKPKTRTPSRDDKLYEL
ncbi:MAG: zinc ribbon domain-containing protein [Deltaproteobacteria bacterium]|nr:zinc ribbon domain-containing protein [Deltaproteobacteria bacterium]MBW2081500.1 zinc ribbon domain-containing protein [Deltaproteobacteria bacterium]HDM10583.1 zinc ribbon domain-containing protein [Desulfobacteraceae bacterium]